jgi:hypothetical protein
MSTVPPDDVPGDEPGAPQDDAAVEPYVPPDVRVVEYVVPSQPNVSEATLFLSAQMPAIAEQLRAITAPVAEFQRAMQNILSPSLLEATRAVQNLMSPSVLELQRAMLEQTKSIAPLLEQMQTFSQPEWLNATAGLADVLRKVDGISKWAEAIQLPQFQIPYTVFTSASGSMILSGSARAVVSDADYITITEDAEATEQPPPVVLIEQKAQLARRVARRGFVGLTPTQMRVICLMAAIFAACGLIELSLPPEVQHGMDVEGWWISIGLAFAFFLLSNRDS